MARGAVNTPGMVARTKRMIRRALELQMAGAGFTFVEVLTMCPTGLVRAHARAAPSTWRTP